MMPEHIDHPFFFIDMLMLFRTIKTVFFPKGPR